ncbi:D-arabinono-1,4-lactone oxidase [Mangrovihabitans endophyticus]|uniref:FAD-linked oxidoreductase n=1 Tax=Mangrovihabitans endophyticus TaxID=1751298 RepID=A0A8J3BZK4_9ACTN|nr:D-arabinono-1,4-lactone oxidase [Mangrovihabitans endophyticus]GGK96660.1 FAD-linked oxidoreductase [Mangrovihabitans endophyticus]
MTSDRRTPVGSRRWRNWGGNQEAMSADVFAPGSVDDVAALVKQAAGSGRRIKAVGSGHSFTAIAAAEDQRLQLHRLASPVAISQKDHLVTVQAGMPLYALNTLLAAQGMALPNLGDIDAQTVAGAVSTGTHGTGVGYSTLASCVEAVTLVTGSGAVERITADSPLFPAARLGLGALGIMTEVTLRCVDAFTLLADERPMVLADVLAGLDEFLAANRHVEFYWYPYTNRAQLKRNNVAPDDDRPLSAFRGWLDDELLANTALHGACLVGRAVPAAVPAINAVAARALTARTYTARSDRVFCTPRRVRFTEMEYEIPREAMPEVLAALPRIIDDLPFQVQFPVEVRFTGPDDVWMSHGYGRESAYIAVHQFRGRPYEPYFRAVEQVCAPLGGRPHWGKMHYRDAASLRAAYPKFDDFLAARDRLDPERTFTNPYLDRVLGA